MALANPRHERIAQALASGMNNVEAYLAAGYSSKSRIVASQYVAKLKRDSPDFKLRVQELMDERGALEVAARAARQQQILNPSGTAEMTQEWLILELMTNVRDARAMGNMAAANKALEMIGDLKGLWPDRPVGRPPKSDPNVEKNPNGNNASPTVHVSILNQLAERAAGAGRTVVANGRPVDAAGSDGIAEDDGDDGAIESDESLGRLRLAIGSSLSGATETELIEEPVVLRRVHDAG